MERADLPPIRNGAKNGGWIACLIRSGIPYSSQSAAFDRRDNDGVLDDNCIPFGEVPFTICAVYRHPSSNGDDSFAGKIYTEAFFPSQLSPSITNCLVIGKFNLELKEPPSCLAETDLSEWAQVHHLRDIADGDPTCIPPVNTSVDLEGRAIDLSLLDVSSVPDCRWGGLGHSHLAARQF